MKKKKEEEVIYSYNTKRKKWKTEIEMWKSTEHIQIFM